MNKNKNKRFAIPDVSNNKNIEHHNGKKILLKLGAGDVYYFPKFIKSASEKNETFKNIINETDFVPMFHFKNNNDEKLQSVEPIPRLLSAQTDKTGSSSAIYRMPGCNQSNIKTSNWTPTVSKVCSSASEFLKSMGEYIDPKFKSKLSFNHSVCTLFRNEDDSLAYHHDKLLDLEPDSLILSLSFGSARPIVFKEVNGKHQQSIMLQSGSLLAIGPKTNKRYQHAIPKVDFESGPRVSLSVRNIKTFYDEEKNTITGQGKDHQTKNYPYITSHDDTIKYNETIVKTMQNYTLECKQYLDDLRVRLN